VVDAQLERALGGRTPTIPSVRIETNARPRVKHPIGIPSTTVLLARQPSRRRRTTKKRTIALALAVGGGR